MKQTRVTDQSTARIQRCICLSSDLGSFSPQLFFCQEEPRLFSAEGWTATTAGDLLSLRMVLKQALTSFLMSLSAPETYTIRPAHQSLPESLLSTPVNPAQPKLETALPCLQEHAASCPLQVWVRRYFVFLLIESLGSTSMYLCFKRRMYLSK